jgi:hypothetical protein
VLNLEEIAECLEDEKLERERERRGKRKTEAAKRREEKISSF